MGLHQLRSLALPDAPGVTTLGALEPRRNLPRLRHLNLQHTGFDDEGMASLEGIGGLESLNLNATKVTDAGLVHLRGLRTLRSLSLDSTSVTSAGLVHLGALGQLRTLSLNDTQVTDSGLVHLYKMKNLQRLNLYRTGTSAVEVYILGTKLPSSATIGRSTRDERTQPFEGVHREVSCPRGLSF